MNRHDFIAIGALVLFFGWFLLWPRSAKIQRVSATWKPRGDRDGR